ncbi:MAG: 3-phosphoshikimate 1-carboxyvinyltransferase, partial [Flavobacteriaceae bacterium]|nr:3-phosphoshikimate 1-carboxyvinyltransferase [Flavobacteriaceae bacterium]
MNLQLSKKNNSCSGSIVITGSKSETNRLLLLQALFPQLTIKNISNSDDAKLMAKGLQVQKGTVDIHHAGTAMRFLTGYFANKPEAEVVLTGSDRMQHRPIKILVDALRDLGADIQYVQSEGYPPLSIKGKRLENKKVRIPANISSQYITSLILLGVAMPKGLKIVLEGEITSVPYIRMTLALLHQIGVRATFEHNTIQVFPP